MNPVGQHLLARAGLAQDQHVDEAARGAAAGGALRQPIELAHRLRLEDRAATARRSSGPRSSAVARPISASAERPSAGYVADGGPDREPRGAHPPGRVLRDRSRPFGIGVEQQRLVVARRVLGEQIARAQRARDQLGARAGGLLVVDLDAHDRQRRAAARGPRARILQALLERAVALKAASRRGRAPALDHEVGEADRDRLAELDRQALPGFDPLAAHERAVRALQILDGQLPLASMWKRACRRDASSSVMRTSALSSRPTLTEPPVGSACVSNRFGAITARCSAPSPLLVGSLLDLDSCTVGAGIFGDAARGRAR